MLSGPFKLVKRCWQLIADLVDEAPISTDRKARLFHYTIFVILGIPTMVAFGLYNLAKANYLLCGLVLVSGSGLLLGWWFLRRLSEGENVYRINAALFALLLLYMVVLGGSGGSKILWMYTFPLIAFFLFGSREGLYWSGGILAVILVLFFGLSDHLDVYPYPDEYKVRFVTTYLIVSAVTYWFEYQRHRYRVGMENEHRKLKIEKSLLNKQIAERRKAEKEKEIIEAQLQRTQKMEAIGTLAGGVAHDLNNILSGLVSYPELLLLDVPEDSPLRKPILTIQESGIRAAAVVQELLTLARRGVAVRAVVNLNDLVAEYLNTPEFEKLKEFHPDVELEVNLDKDLLNIMGSPIHLSKTIMNLVSNAAEALPEGGGIFVSTENQYIDRPIRGYEDISEGEYAVLSVSDTGLGISSEDLARIFEPFYTKKVMGRSGTGLGMSVVWGTVRDHEGYIDIETIPAKGTKCKLYFPITREEPTDKKTAVPIEEYMGSESILVVDDVSEQREVAQLILTRLGYSVTTVASGEEAIEYLKSNTADLAILDMIMDPGMDGLDTYKGFLAYRPRQKVIIASGFSETERVKEAKRLGVSTYIRKPYSIEKIGLAVRVELDK